MPTLTEFTTNLTKDLSSTLDARPLYAALGVTDLSVEKARTAAARVEEFGVAVRAEFDKLVADLQPAKVEARTVAAFGQVKDVVTAAPEVARAGGSARLEQVTKTYVQITKTYGDLAERGEKLVEQIRSQQATKDLLAQADTTVAQAKGAVSTARKAATDIERSAKATVTTARKEAVKVAEAITASVTDEVATAEAEVAGAVKRTRTAAKRTSTTTRNAAKKTTASARGVRTTAKQTAAAAETATLKAAATLGD